jgi:hypothetical protein
VTDRPTLRVVRGDPDPVELAAVVVALATIRAADDLSTTRRSAWTDRAAHLRAALPAGPGAWRAAARRPGARTRSHW